MYIFHKNWKTENLNKKHENLENAKMDIFHHFEQMSFLYKQVICRSKNSTSENSLSSEADHLSRTMTCWD